MIELFVKGGPIMWPILLLSVLTMGVVIERILFLVSELSQRDPQSVHDLFARVEHARLEEAVAIGLRSKDRIARVLTEGLVHREASLSDALLEGASSELARYNRGLVMLDTAVTLGPLLGLLGTVVGMIQAFGIVGGADLAGKQSAITGGIAESLIAVCFGLCVAIVALVPLNYLNAVLESTRRKLEAAINRLELLVAKQRHQQHSSPVHLEVPQHRG